MKQYLIITIILLGNVFAVFSFSNDEKTNTVKSPESLNTISLSIVFSQSQVVITDTITNALCWGDANGAINITVAGGNPPYTYIWSNGATTEDISGLIVGTYMVTVTASNNQSASEIYTINEPAILVATDSITDILCFGDANGEINLTVTGGTQPYSYIWNDSATSEDRQSLSTGIYSVTITDANNCIFNGSYTITEPTTALSATGNVTNIVCFGNNNGEIDITVIGGTLPYSFIWNDSATTEDRQTLSAGNYDVTITDANNCLSTANFTITEPGNTFSVSDIITDVLCYGNSTGAINITVNSAVAPYSFAWNNSATTEDISGLGSGTFSLTITDANTCEFSASYIVNQPTNPLSSSVNITHVLCYGDASGEINITVAGGTQPYSYLWNDNTTTEDRVNISNGTYIITITDNHNCEYTANYTVNEPAAALTSSGAVTNVLCYGDSNGEINLTVTGGTQPYSYLWNDNSTTEDRETLSAGTYNVTITDNNNCETTDSYTINEPAAALSSTEVISNILCYGDNNGEINLTVTGGTQPYSYLWNDNSTTEDRETLSAGTYNVTITDFNDCEFTDNYTITQPAILETAGSTSFQNPSACGVADGSINLDIQGGITPYSYNWSNSETTSDLSLLPFGNYYVTITDNNSCQLEISFTLVDPNSPVIEFSDSIKPCFQDSNGELYISIQSGTPPYSYEWSTGVTDQNLTGVSQGMYMVTVIDILNCSSTIEININEYPLPIIELNSYNDSVCEAGEISFEETGSDATGWEWTGPGITTAITNSSLTITNVNLNYEGWYNCAITASQYNNCPADVSFYLKVNPLPNIPSISGDFELCSGEFPAHYGVENALTGMSYHWSLDDGYISSWADSSTTLIAWDINPGNYELYLQVTDKISECSNQETFIVHVSNNYAPEETQIVYNSGMNILVCEDEAPDILYQWGFDTIATGGEYYIPGEILRYCVIPHDFDSTLYAYWVETYFVFDGNSDTCIYRTYYNGSPYFVYELQFDKYNFNLFPNPVNTGKLNLQIYDRNLHIEGVRIFNLNGQKLFETKPVSNQIRIDIGSLKPGVYTCTVEFENRIYVTRKFIIN